MHKFLLKNEIGFNRDFGSPKSGAEFAKRVIGGDAVAFNCGNDTLWMMEEDKAYWQSQFTAPFGPRSFGTASEMLAKFAADAAASSAHSMRVFADRNATGKVVRHKKFGEGRVVREDDRLVEVQFPSQKRLQRIAHGHYEVVA